MRRFGMTKDRTMKNQGEKIFSGQYRKYPESAIVAAAKPLWSFQEQYQYTELKSGRATMLRCSILHKRLCAVDTGKHIMSLFLK